METIGSDKIIVKQSKKREKLADILARRTQLCIRMAKALYDNDTRLVGYRHKANVNKILLDWEKESA